MGHYIFQPTKLMLKSSYTLEMDHEMLYNPIAYKEVAIKGQANMIWKNRLSTGLSLRYNFEEHDYNEARTENQVFIRPPKFNSSFTVQVTTEKDLPLIQELE